MATRIVAEVGEDWSAGGPTPSHPARAGPHLRFALELELGALPGREKPGWG